MRARYGSRCSATLSVAVSHGFDGGRKLDASPSMRLELHRFDHCCVADDSHVRLRLEINISRRANGEGVFGMDAAGISFDRAAARY